jgi:cell shape-determining protein MreC
MLRIALIIALLAAIGSLALSFLHTEPTVSTLRADLATTKGTLVETTGKLTQTTADLKKTAGELETRSKDLESTKTQLEEASTAAANNKRRADQLDATLAKTKKEKEEAQAQLAQWDALGVKPDQVVQMRSDLRKTTDEKNALADEKNVFLKNIVFLKNRLAKYETPDQKVELPAGLKGSVIAVGPLQDFVLLDFGENQGALERGELMVRRGDKLVGKVSIVKVQSNRCIANIIPQWKQGNVAIAEGDQVLY